MSEKVPKEHRPQSSKLAREAAKYGGGLLLMCGGLFAEHNIVDEPDDGATPPEVYIDDALFAGSVYFSYKALKNAHLYTEWVGFESDQYYKERERKMLHGDLPNFESHLLDRKLNSHLYELEQKAIRKAAYGVSNNNEASDALFIREHFPVVLSYKQGRMLPFRAQSLVRSLNRAVVGDVEYPHNRPLACFRADIESFISEATESNNGESPPITIETMAGVLQEILPVDPDSISWSGYLYGKVQNKQAHASEGQS